jgi:hypothetical protein
VAGIITYQSSWTPPFGDAFRSSIAELGAYSQLDLGCALLHGVFETRYPAGAPAEITVIEGPRSLVEFLMRLLKQLQALATAPAIDYNAYLERFERAVGPTA